MSKLCFLIPFLVLFQLAQTKHFNKQLSINEFEDNNWFYLTKFGAHVGKTRYIFTAKLLNVDETLTVNKTISMNSYIYLDEKWEYIEEIEECQRKDLTNVKWNMEVPVTGEFTRTGNLNQHVRQHIWYFAITDCENNFFKNFKGTNAILEIDIQLFNTNDSQFSSEESGTIYFIGLLCLVNTIIFILHFRHIRKDYQKNEETDWALLLLIFAMGIETIQNYALFIHLLSYSEDGTGLESFEVASDLFQVLCRFVLTVLIILISWGWSINYIDFHHRALWIPIGIVVGALQVAIMGLGKIANDENDKYHQFDGWVGYAICIVEVALLIYFFLGIKETSKKAGIRVRGFISQFAIYASLYFLGFPVLLVISKILAAYLRYKFITLGTFSVRIIAIALLARLFTSKQSEYHDISYKNISLLDRAKYD